MTGLSNGHVDMDAGAQGPSAERTSNGADGGRADGASVARVVGGGSNSGVVRLPRAQLPAQTANEAVALLGLIERAAADPAVDLDRMERMYAMYERATARTAKSAYLDALMSAKGKLPRIIKTGSAAYEDKKTGEAKKAFSYAKWEEVCPQIEPVLADHGLVLTFSTEHAGAAVAVTGILSHRDGHSERAQIAISCDASGGKNNAQGWGSAVSYGKRYTSFALLNLVGHDDKDTDGATPPADPSAKRAELAALIAEVKADTAKICEHFSVETIDDLNADQIGKVITGLKARQRNGSGK